MMLEEARQGQSVEAVQDIHDCPLASLTAGARRGAVGTVEDIDSAAGYLLVDFGSGAIVCAPHEVMPV